MVHPYNEISKEFEGGRLKLDKWAKQYKQNGGIDLKLKKEKRSKEWSSDKRVSVLIEIEIGDMSSEDRTFWCRRKGTFFPHQAQWKKEAVSGLLSIFEKNCVSFFGGWLRKRAATLMVSLAAHFICSRITAINGRI